MNTTNPSVDLSKYDNNFSLKNKIGRAFWNICYWLFFRAFGLKLFNNYRIFVLKLFGANIGANTVIYANVRIWAPWNLKIGNYVCLGRNVDCYNQGKISIGNNTTISQKTYLCASSHDIYDPKNKLLLKPIIIEDQVWVAADSFIGPGVSIKQGAVVGARSSVFKNVDSWTVVGGNPAIFLKKRRLYEQ